MDNASSRLIDYAVELEDVAALIRRAVAGDTIARDLLCREWMDGGGRIGTGSVLAAAWFNDDQVTS